ncbi:Mannosyl-oligosaccharide 1,2-alpha-mannosidase IA [Folsomia candida]|uniref:alpha-1,2-Mannosidase n=1 Tax=Folsomia candida TaxID=158441 RepID=A0A226EEB3_FOLCA|nr:Mannosyl-oligosaccharide 1,2-alpha-mannosidase IA [Folsomia candida]
MASFPFWSMICIILLIICTISINAQQFVKPVLTQGGEDPDPVIRARRDFVKQMMKDAWDHYVEKAWGENELKPISEVGQPGNHFGGAKVGCTIVDSLDTLYIMEMMEEFTVARDFVRDELDWNVDASISQFEATIRFMGGLLSAYALSNDPVFLKKVVQLTDLLQPVFDTPTGLPYRHINILTGEPNRTNEKNFLAEVATLHLEYNYLTDITGNPTYRQRVDVIRNFLNQVPKPYNGLYPSELNVITGEWTSMGPPTDSIFEYFLKSYIETGLPDTLGLQMYYDSINAFFDNGLIQTSSPSNLEYNSEMVNGTADPVVHHLTCFAGGMLALGVYWMGSEHPNATRDMQLAINFTNTCYESYLRSVPKLGPVRFRFDEDEEAVGISETDRDWKLRPELIETFVILFRIRGDTKYRDWGWEIAQNIERYCKAGPGKG